MKKLINKAEDVVREELEGIELAHPDLVKVSYDPAYIVRADAPSLTRLSSPMQYTARKIASFYT